MKLDLNCDLGEGELFSRTRALMRCITSANVACGGHAGNMETMLTCVRLAKQYRVRIGAHPGAWDREQFGRASIQITPPDLDLLLLHQVGALEKVARSVGLKLHHIKLHGALYHTTESDERLARRYVAAVARWWPQARIYAAAGGLIARLSQRARVRVWEEVFADRAYREDGSLLSRDQPTAVFDDVRKVIQRAQELLRFGEITTVSGKKLKCAPQTLCFHSDTPAAVEIAKALLSCLAEPENGG
jgi:5-oxoprolinase (ATP-hydrolysing) subunit A